VTVTLLPTTTPAEYGRRLVERMAEQSESIAAFLAEVRALEAEVASLRRLNIAQQDVSAGLLDQVIGLTDEKEFDAILTVLDTAEIMALRAELAERRAGIVDAAELG
jgi:hypothetical protein